MQAEARARLAAWLGQAFGAPFVLLDAKRLSGGAIQENWLVDGTIGEEPRGLIIRKDAPAAIASSHSRRDEFALIRAARPCG
jgi:hypothetical protein